MHPAAHHEEMPAGAELAYRPFDPRHPVNRMMLAYGDALRAYHRHTVRGLEHLTAALANGGRVVLVGNHCLDLVDPLMLNVAVYHGCGHALRFIGHGNIFFRIPILRELAPIWGIIPNRNPDLAHTVLREERALMLYPGSGAEAFLRSYWREPYRLKWYGRLGFVELAAHHRATLLFVAAIGIDELYYQTRIPSPAALVRFFNAGDARYYEGSRLQLGAAGVHFLPSITPLPVRVTHVISPPLPLDPNLDPHDARAVELAQIELWAAAQAFLDRTIAARERDSDILDRTCRRAMTWLHGLGL